MSFLVQIFWMVMNDILVILIWYLFFQEFGVIGGWQFEEYVLLISIVAMSFWTAWTFFGGFNHMSDMILYGRLDSQLLLPWNLLVRLLVSRMLISTFWDIIFAIALLFLLPNISLLLILKVIILWLLSSFVMIGFFVIFVSLAFYTGTSERFFYWVREAILGLSFYPYWIFDGTILKFLMMSIIPAFFVAYLPHSLVTNFNWNDFALLVWAAVFFMSFWSFVFYSGLKRYESWNMINVNV